jgi:uncharacterized protein (DUF1697 family)
VAIQVALLRGVNVGGNRKVAMADLRAAVTEMGFTDVQSLLQSGNLVFRAAGRAGGATLERALEHGVEQRLGVGTDFHVRTVAEWEAAIAANPFPAEARRDPGHLLVLFMKEAPTPKAVHTLQAAITGRERVRAEGRQAYLVYPDGAGRSRVTTAVLDKHLGGRGTARNWNTVLKLAELAKPQ